MDSADVCRWYGAYGQPVPELGRVRATDDGLLTIGNADVLDSGNYTCSAVNLAGTTSRTVWIVVSGDCRAASSRVAWPGGEVVRALDWLLKSSRVRSLAVPFPCNNLGHVVCRRVPLSPSGIIWYRSSGGDALRLGG